MVDISGRPSGQHQKTFVVVCLVLAVGIVATWSLRTWHKSRILRAGGSVRHEAVQSALAEAEAQFATFRDDVQRFGERLAEDEHLQTGLLKGKDGRANLIRYLAALPVPEWWSVEVYDADGQVVAWKEHGFPFGPGEEVGVVNRAAYIVQDGAWRRALVVWQPVLSTEGAVGVVRVMRTIERRYPVQNAYLEDYDMRGTWQLDVGLPVEYMWAPPEAPGPHAVPLLGLQADTLGYASVALPPITSVALRVGHYYDDALSFLALLLLGWLLAGAWYVHRLNPGRIGVLVILLTAWWGARFVLISLDIPGRWQQGKAPLSPLFDTAHMHSEWGWGLLQSSADLLLTSLFVLVSALIILRAMSFRAQWPSWQDIVRQKVRFIFVLQLAVVSGASLGLVTLLGVVSRHVVVQSNIELFARDGLLPVPLVQVVFGALLLCAVSTAVLIAALILVAIGRGDGVGAGGSMGALVAVGVMVVAVAVFDWQGWVSWPVGGGFIVVAVLLLTVPVKQPGTVLGWVTLRRILPATLAAAILLYPLTFRGLEERRRIHMESAAAALEADRDAGIPDLIDTLLTENGTAYPLSVLVDSVAAPPLQRRLDSLELDALILVLGPEGQIRSRHAVGGSSSWSRILPVGSLATLQDAGTVAVRERERVRFAGVGMPVSAESLRVAIVAERRADHQQSGASPLVRVLTDPEASGAQTGMSMATFRSGVLVYKLGRAFRQYRLDSEVATAISTVQSLWHRDVQGGRRYDTYYRQMAHGAEVARILAVRASAPTTFDHLYYLLRLIVAGLMLGIPLFVGGIIVRWRKGLLPSSRLHFRDRVLNAFLVVGIIAVGTVGLVGVEVVTEENDRAVQSWLRQHLQSIEATLFQQTVGDEPAYRALERISLDSLAVQTGLDLMLYREARLVGATRGHLVEDRVVDQRLPMEALEALQLDDSDFAFVDHDIGSFRVTAGYKALLDEAGALRYVLSVPALPEQERIEEERARTLAYLFGALLFVLVLVMSTASLLASAVARPIGRLRAGLAAVAVGRFEQLPATRSKDEVGELVETFNDMQSQLVESRGRLAQQERKLAWREMARQVAHEINNPLTPMKLSVQHLRRALEEAPEEKFRKLFDRVTATLVDQMDAMARIANEFASFARMPARSLQTVNLAEVIEEAVCLMREEASGQATMVLDLTADPLYMEADREELRRIYINLVKNALEAVRNKEDGKVIVTACVSESGMGESTVTDNGPGIHPEIGDCIFEPSFSTKTSGTGLGLAIARRSVEDLGGEIGYRPAPAGGSIFWLVLPIQSSEKLR